MRKKRTDLTPRLDDWQEELRLEAARPLRVKYRSALQALLISPDTLGLVMMADIAEEFYGSDVHMEKVVAAWRDAEGLKDHFPEACTLSVTAYCGGYAYIHLWFMPVIRKADWYHGAWPVRTSPDPAVRDYVVHGRMCIGRLLDEHAWLAAVRKAFDNQVGEKCCRAVFTAAGWEPTEHGEGVLLEKEVVIL